eukprot:403355830
MLSQLFKASLRHRNVLMRPAFKLCAVPQRFYYPNGQLMTREDGQFYGDPKDVAERFIRLMALHDNVRDPSAITLQSSFEELGLNTLDMAEILLAAEREFDLELADEDCESFHSVNDVVEFLSRTYAVK